MTDKEIIIDGVDVAGCEFHSSTPCSELCYMKGNKCNDNSKCYFKQLARKTRECEELRKSLSIQTENLDKIIGCTSLWEDFTKEESELAKNSSIADLIIDLREKDKNLREKQLECKILRGWRKYAHKTIQQQSYSILQLKKEIKEDNLQIIDWIVEVKKLNYKNNSYKQAIKEIKEIAEDNFYYLDSEKRWVLNKIIQKCEEVNGTI